jgi:hypothetical protein
MKIFINPKLLGFVSRTRALKQVQEKDLAALDFLVWHGRRYYRQIDVENLNNFAENEKPRN